jgi:peptide-methionine (R)-S-oxide reductase
MKQSESDFRYKTNTNDMKRRNFIQILGGISLSGLATAQQTQKQQKVIKTEAEWKKTLTPQQFYVMRQKGTERAFTGLNWDNHDKGTYKCAGCGTPLFESKTKFDSGTGWPSFYAPLKKENVAEKTDGAFGMTRTEVLCAVCDAHLGHVFDDGPKPTGMRYCMNGTSMNFEKSK